MTTSELRQTWTKVATLRSNGVNARWGTLQGRPYMYVQKGSQWFALTKAVLDSICSWIDSGQPLADAVDSALALTDFFSISAK